MSLKKILVVAGLIVLAAVIYWQMQSDPAASSASDVSSAELESMAFRQQILHASDLLAGVAQAVENNDDKAIEQWQRRAVEVAEAAGLTPGDITFIRSEKGREYLIFHAKRRLFNQAFEKNYYALKGIDALKTQYPEARDLFAEAEKLIASRDAIISDIASELTSDSVTQEEALKQAKLLWQERFRQSDMPTKN